MNVGGTVVAVLFAVCCVIVVATVAAVYALWKDGCCRKREEETEEQGRSPRRGASRQNSSLFQYLTRFTDSGRHRNNVISTPPSGVVRAKRPSVDTDVEDDVESGEGDNGLTSEYNRLASPPVAYELPASEQRATYEDVRPRGLAVPQTAGRDDGFENSGRYDYVQSESVRYELSVDGGGRAPSTSQVPGHYETSQSFQVAPPSQHYAMSYATPSISQSRSETEARNTSVGGRQEIYQEPAKDRRSLYAQFKNFKIKLIPRESISITGFLGSGEFGKVQKGEWSSGGRRGGSLSVAIKSLKENSDEDSKVKFLQEVAIMGQFSHPNVVRLHGLISTDEPLMIVIELLLKGDLRNHLISLRNEASKNIDSDIPSTLLCYCRDIAKGMSYLASKAFVHRDLAARNILISEELVCKVADFGMSRELAEADYYVSQGGQIPVKWTAPDALHYRKYSTASDVWSFGCVMYEIWSLGHKPFESYSNIQAMQMIGSGYRLPPPPGCPKPLYSLMIRCWHSDATVRPMFSAIFKMLSHSDSQLLSWSEKDKAVHPEASCLGASLEAGDELYTDLQDYYLDELSKRV